jgi:hypothetical protein
MIRAGLLRAVVAMLTNEFGGSGPRNEMLLCEPIKMSVQNDASVKPLTGFY